MCLKVTKNVTIVFLKYGHIQYNAVRYGAVRYGDASGIKFDRNTVTGVLNKDRLLSVNLHFKLWIHR